MDRQQFDRLVDLFESATDGDGDKLNMHCLLIKQGETEFFHAFGGRIEPLDIRSLSKTIMALITGTIMESRDDFTEDTPVWPAIQRDLAGIDRGVELIKDTCGFQCLDILPLGLATFLTSMVINQEHQYHCFQIRCHPSHKQSDALGARPPGPWTRSVGRTVQGIRAPNLSESSECWQRERRDRPGRRVPAT